MVLVIMNITYKILEYTGQKKMKQKKKRGQKMKFYTKCFSCQCFMISLRIMIAGHPKPDSSDMTDKGRTLGDLAPGPPLMLKSISGL